MSPWKIFYALGGAMWLAHGLWKVAHLFTEGTMTISPAPTRTKLVAVALTIFWSYVCAAVLWPGSLVVMGIAVLLLRLGDPDDEEEQ